jgi:hypothetical protein
MRQRCCRLPRLSWNLIRVFNRAAAAISYIDLLAALDWLRPPGGQPFLDFRQVPDHAARGECKAARELSTLLHAEDRAVSERHDFSELLPSDGASVGQFTSFCHDFGTLSATFWDWSRKLCDAEGIDCWERRMAKDRQATATDRQDARPVRDGIHPNSSRVV